MTGAVPTPKLPTQMNLSHTRTRAAFNAFPTGATLSSRALTPLAITPFPSPHSDWKSLASETCDTILPESGGYCQPLAECGSFPNHRAPNLWNSTERCEKPLHEAPLVFRAPVRLPWPLCGPSRHHVRVVVGVHRGRGHPRAGLRVRDKGAWWSFHIVRASGILR